MSFSLLAADMAARAAEKLFNEYRDVTTLHPIGVAAVVVLGCWLLWSPRRMALLPLMILICFIPSAQRIVILGADFTLLRIMILFGLVRILARAEIAKVQINRIDIAYVAWVIIGSLVYVIQRQELSAAVYVSGTSMDMLGAYILARALVRKINDFRVFVAIMAALAILVSGFFVLEHFTGRNVFSIFGGVSETTAIRNGRLRCQGAFSHPILAGVFWAAVGAMLIGPSFSSRRRALHIFGAIGCVLIIAASSSSTPALGFIAAIAFWAWWPIRHWMKYAFFTAPFLLFSLHMVMDKPVWHLVSRVSAVGGSTGYHRYVLINETIRHFDEWWLVGVRTTVHWSDNFQLFDITNQYVKECVNGGIWRFGLFVIVILFAAFAIGRSVRRAETRSDQLLMWGLGASLFVHCVCFIGVSYFGQIQYLWFITLAIAASTADRGFTMRQMVDDDDTHLTDEYSHDLVESTL